MNTPRYRFPKRFALLSVFKALWQSLWQAYARAVLFLASRGFVLPGQAAARKTVAPQTISAYERRALVYELKASRYQYAHGPLWVRATVDVLGSLWQKNAFWVALLAKGTFGILFLILPLAVFLLLRGVLPVPERVPERRPALTLSARTSLRIERPYVAQMSSPEGMSSLLALRNDNETLRGISVRDLPEGGGLVQVTLGSLPRRLEKLRGFLLSESQPLSLSATKETRVAVEGLNRLRASWFAFPSESREPVSCRLELLALGNDKPFVSANFSSSPPLGGLASRLAALFLSRFTPDYAFEPVSQGELFFDTDALPSQITARVVRTLPAEATAALREEMAPHAPSTECLVFLGEPAFEWQSVSSSPRRGALVVVVEGLRPEDVENPEDAPFLASLARQGSFHFAQHRMSTDDPASNTAALLTASPWMQGAGREASLASALRAAGFRLGAFGTFSSASALFDGFDVQVSLEAREYQARHVTEEASAWLERFGEAPFLGVLQYSTLLPPFRPPFSTLPVLELVKGPFGFARERALRRGLLRYLDAEIQRLSARTKALGVWGGIDVLVASNGSLPFFMESFSDFKGFPREFRGAPRVRRSGLFEDALRAPLVWKPAESGVLNLAHRVERPTFQADVGRTLFSLLGSEAKKASQPDVRTPLGNTLHTVDFSDALVAGSLLDLNSLLSERRLMPLSGSREIGALVFSEPGVSGALKVVDAFVPLNVEFMKDEPPYFERRRLPVGERFTLLAEAGPRTGSRGRPRSAREIPLSADSKGLVRKLRNTLSDLHFPKGRPLTFTFVSGQAGAFPFLENALLFQFAERENVRILDVPSNLQVAWEGSGAGGAILRVWGVVSAQEQLRLAFPADSLLGIQGAFADRFLVCQGAYQVTGEALSALVRERHPCLVSHDALSGGLPLVPQDLFIEAAFESAPSLGREEGKGERLANEALGR